MTVDKYLITHYITKHEIDDTEINTSYEDQ